MSKWGLYSKGFSRFSWAHQGKCYSCGDPIHMYSTILMPSKGGREPPHDKTNKMACALSEDSDQPGHLSSLIRVFAVCMKKAWVLTYLLSEQRRRRMPRLIWVFPGRTATLLVLSWVDSYIPNKFFKTNQRNRYELPHVKTNKMICAPSEDSDQPGHPPSVISLRFTLNG